MTEQKRITPEMVLEAYKKTGLVPKQGATCLRDGEVYYGCALGAMYLATNENVPRDSHGDPLVMSAYNWSEKEYGDYGCAFRRGFDGSALLARNDK